MKKAVSLFIDFVVISVFIIIDAGVLRVAVNTDVKWITIVMSMLFTVLLSVTIIVVWLLQELHKAVMMKDGK